ncbi:MAG TPA: NAD(P)-dependent oxidoreductase [Anaerovoracaceae bacterium]|nr:NAD(P)-dependent oxidoreductase [Anaerovoracaceae bacterium]
MKKVGWIGVGKMGSRMSRRLQENGYPLMVFDTNPDAAKDLIASGAAMASSPKDLAEKVDYVFTMIPNTAILEEVVSGPGGLTEANGDYILIDMSTVAPDGSARVAEALAKTGAGFLRAPVSGSTSFAEEGTLAVMVSGDRALYDEVLPLFKILGNRQTYIGEGELSRYVKIAINMMVNITMQMFSEAVILGKKAGVPWDVLIDLIADSAPASPNLKAKVDRIKKRDWTAMSTVTTSIKDLQLALDIAKDEGIALPLTSIVKEYYGAMKNNGWADLDFGAILLLNEKMNNLSE